MFTQGIFTQGTSQIRDSTFNIVSTDGDGVAVIFEDGGAGSAVNTIVRADFVGHALIFADDVTIDNSIVNMALSNPPFGTLGVRAICFGTCANVSVHNVVVRGTGYVDPTTPDFANDSIGFQFSYPTDFRNDLALHDSVGFYTAAHPTLHRRRSCRHSSQHQITTHSTRSMPHFLPETRATADHMNAFWGALKAVLRRRSSRRMFQST